MNPIGSLLMLLIALQMRSQEKQNSHCPIFISCTTLIIDSLETGVFPCKINIPWDIPVSKNGRSTKKSK